MRQMIIFKKTIPSLRAKRSNLKINGLLRCARNDEKNINIC